VSRLLIAKGRGCVRRQDPARVGAHCQHFAGWTECLDLSMGTSRGAISPQKLRDCSANRGNDTQLTKKKKRTAEGRKVKGEMKTKVETDEEKLKGETKKNRDSEAKS